MNPTQLSAYLKVVKYLCDRQPLNPAESKLLLFFLQELNDGMYDEAGSIRLADSYVIALSDIPRSTFFSVRKSLRERGLLNFTECRNRGQPVTYTFPLSVMQQTLRGASTADTTEQETYKSLSNNNLNTNHHETRRNKRDVSEDHRDWSVSDEEGYNATSFT